MIKTRLITPTEIISDISLDDCKSSIPDGSSLLWVNVQSFTKEELNHLAELFNFHSLAVTSCLDGYRRPHLYEFGDHFYVNLTTVKRGGAHGMAVSELHLFAGSNFIITMTKGKGSDAVDKAFSEFIESPGLCERGPMYAVYLLAEDLIETYFPIVEKLDNEADNMETAMLHKANETAIRKLFHLKRQGFELRRLLGPQRDIFNELARRDFPFIQGECRVFFQDAYNRMVRIFDMLDTIREILSGSLDIYLSSVSNRLNEVMKVLTVAATILMAMSFITGFYGMNFVHLPWLESTNAFRNIIIVMGVITIGMLLWFKRKGWL